MVQASSKTPTTKQSEPKLSGCSRTNLKIGYFEDTLYFVDVFSPREGRRKKGGGRNPQCEAGPEKLAPAAEPSCAPQFLTGGESSGWMQGGENARTVTFLEVDRLVSRSRAAHSVRQGCCRATLDNDASPKTLTPSPKYVRRTSS